ncbi:hypothetical protein HYT26_00270 [Candidatus Pacearchaeota archaeon]|nr:hypothetical protein [Candidatus Pacearchaeota archaeon]
MIDNIMSRTPNSFVWFLSISKIKRFSMTIRNIKFLKLSEFHELIKSLVREEWNSEVLKTCCAISFHGKRA